MLDDRLRAIADMIPACGRFADIGTDHGYLGAYLLQTGRVQTAELTDISAESLAKAKRLIDSMGLTDRCAFAVGDGCRALTQRPDAAVIAGMGGMTISGIVREGKDMLSQSLVVVQPNLDMHVVRRAFMETGFFIVGERIARAGGRHYVIIAARPGKAEYDDAQLEVGPVLLQKGDPNLASFARFRVRVAEKALRGAKSADAPCAADLERELDIWRGVLRKVE